MGRMGPRRVRERVTGRLSERRSPMARTPLARRLEEMSAEVAGAHGGATRRELLRRAGAAGAVVAASAAFPRRLAEASAATAPRIVVVGGGLAGLTAAYR